MKCSALLAMVVMGVVLGGCSTRFPYGMSLDRHNFISTPHQPLSLSLTDTVTGETVWQLDVPVGKMAVVDFEHDTDWVPAQTTALPANKVSWDVMEPGSVVASLSHEQQLSGNPVLLRVDLAKADPDPSLAAPAGTAPAPLDVAQPGPTPAETDEPLPALEPEPAPDAPPESPQPESGDGGTPPASNLGADDNS